MAGSSRVVCAALAVGLAVGGRAQAQPAAPPAPPAPPGLLARTDAIAREVSALRGLPLRAPIAKEVVDRAELRRRLIEMLARPKEAAQLRRETVLAKHWGLVPASTDYAAMVLDLLTAQIAGYYDDETRMLTLTEDPEVDPDWSELVLVHEITHALQDQTFALSKLRQVPEGEDDEAAARLALVEGDGVAVMLEAMAARRAQPLPWSSASSVAAVLEALRESTEPDDDDDAPSVPLAVREQLAFPYRAGFAFIAELRKQRPWRAVDAVFRKPPRSTEQILHPERYLRGDAPISVPKLTPPAALAGILGGRAGKPAPVETVWGELGFSLFLRSHGVHASMAAAAAAGWGGDRVSVVTLGSGAGAREVGVIRSRWDSEVDAREAFDALVLAMDRWVVGALIEHRQERARWLGLDGRVATVERRGSAVLITRGAPLSALLALDAELWRGLPTGSATSKPSSPLP